jgi:ssDNA-binding Zn-finger/Zn-ribbon topoisomerase 1
MSPALATTSKRRLFPCPVCGVGLEIRETKKHKPYVICDPCGVQLFVRNETGMGRLERLLFGAEQKDIWARLEELQHRYHKKCPKCGNWFWIQPDQIKTSWMDGSFEGYRCPERGCDGFAKWKEERKK